MKPGYIIFNPKVWVSSGGDRPVIAHHCKTSNRMLYAIFFDSKGPVLQIPVPKSSSVTGKFYRESVLTQLVERKNCVSTGVKKPGNTCASPTAMI